MKVLFNALGAVGAEQFVSSVMREGLDYTAWRIEGLPGTTLDAAYQAAIAYAASKSV